MRGYRNVGRVAWAAGIFVLMMVVCGGARADVATTRPGVLALSVVDAGTGKAVAGVKITVDSNGQEKQMRCGGDGNANVPMPAEPGYFIIGVDASGYVTRLLSWENEPGKSIPNAYCVRMEKGAHIGGKVTDDAGQPVAGAHVVIELKTAGEDPNAHDRNYVEYQTVDSGADGKWSFEEAPAHFDKGNIGVWDYRYANGDFYAMTKFTPAELRAGSGTVVLHRGLAVNGQVVGPDGKPIAGASVLTGAQMCSNRVPVQHTDKNGSFAYVARPDETVTLTTSYKGYSPELTQFVMGNSPKRVTVQLQKSVVMMGRVMGPDGEPVAFAWIYPDTWRGNRSLDFDNVRTDKNGKFRWEDAPRDTVQFDIDATADGYMRENNVPLTAADHEIIVRVKRALEVTGTVMDEKTGKPIENFKVVPGVSFNADQPVYWQRVPQMMTVGHDGKFAYKVSDGNGTGFAALIEAPGYLPAESRIFTADEKKVSLHFTLAKGDGISAMVVNPAGKPAAWAQAVLASAGQSVYITNGSEIRDQECQKAKVGSDGKVHFGPQVGDYKIAVFGPDGYVTADRQSLSKSNRLTLQPWAQVSGRLMIGKNPGANKMVTVNLRSETYDPAQPMIMNSMETQTDWDGKFKFARVPAGEVTVARQVDLQAGGNVTVSMATSGCTLTLLPGQSVQLQIGGTGRRVEGQVAIPAELANRNDWFFQMPRMGPPPPKLPKMPEEIETGTAEQKRQWLKDFETTPAGKAYQAAMDQWRANQYPLQINQDGSWHADDVAAGDYQVVVAIAKNQEKVPWGGDEIAEGEAKITVPAMPSGRSDVPLNVPAISLAMLKNIEVGQMAPEFSLKTLDGNSLKLSALRGKFVLLDFWATWCGPCVAETPNVKAAYDMFGTNPRLAMVSLSLDETPEAAQRYVREKGLAWNQLFLPGGWESTTVKDYGVRGIPSIWLIGPDGKVVAKELRGDGIKLAVGQALGG